jgi:hypothetical protein
MPLFPNLQSSNLPSKKQTTIKKDLIPAKTAAARLLQSDINRVGLTLRNHSTSPLYLDIDARLTADDCMVEISPGFYYEFPFSPTTEIWGVWDRSDGQVSIRSCVEV